MQREEEALVEGACVILDQLLLWTGSCVLLRGATAMFRWIRAAWGEMLQLMSRDAAGAITRDLGERHDVGWKVRKMGD